MLPHDLVFSYQLAEHLNENGLHTFLWWEDTPNRDPVERHIQNKTEQNNFVSHISSKKQNTKLI